MYALTTAEAGIPYRLGDCDAIVLVRGIDEEKAIRALVDLNLLYAFPQYIASFICYHLYGALVLCKICILWTR